LRTEKLKAQLQKIANSRTGGMKTDETLGKTGGGPEGLPHSIIVTPEGIEGEVAAAVEGAGPGSSEIASTPQADLLPRKPPAGKQGKPGPAGKIPKGKAAQLGLFAGTSSGSRKSHAKPGKTGKTSTARHKK
jgi:DNA topoisomerase-6 subunit B